MIEEKLAGERSVIEHVEDALSSISEALSMLEEHEEAFERLTEVDALLDVCFQWLSGDE